MKYFPGMAQHKTPDLLKVVDFTGLLRLVNNLEQTCQ